MPALEDTRPIVSTTTVSAHPNIIGEDLAQLLLEHPDLELASIRLIREDFGSVQSVHIAGRVGTITQPVCDCYPGGFSPETYEGPQHHCSVHGHGNDLAPSECPACIADQLDRPALRPTMIHPHVATCTGRGCATCAGPGGLSYERPAAGLPDPDAAECPSCHTVAGHPHTEYCQRVGRAPCICPGLGINPDCPRHNHNPAEDEPEQDEPQLESHTVTIGARSTVHHRSLCKPEVCGSEPMP